MDITVNPLLSDPPLRGHPLLGDQWSKSRNYCRKEWEIKPLLSGHGHILATLTRVTPLLSPLLSGHQALHTQIFTEFGSILRIRWRKIQSEIESDNRLWTSNAFLSRFCLKIKRRFCLRLSLFMTIILLRDHLPVPWGWSLDGSSSVFPGEEGEARTILLTSRGNNVGSYLFSSVRFFKYCWQLFLHCFVAPLAVFVFVLVTSWLAFMRVNVDRLGIHHDLILIRCRPWLPENTAF